MKVNLNNVFLVCIQEELEAWLLADHRAVTAMLKPLKHPHPVSRISRVDYRHALLIAREIADFTKLRRSLSFQRFALEVAGREL
jgi:hypothetical protein